MSAYKLALICQLFVFLACTPSYTVSIKIPVYQTDGYIDPHHPTKHKEYAKALVILDETTKAFGLENVGCAELGWEGKTMPNSCRFYLRKARSYNSDRSYYREMSVHAYEDKDSGMFIINIVDPMTKSQSELSEAIAAELISRMRSETRLIVRISSE